MPVTSNLTELLERLSSGDAGAAEELLQQFGPVVMRAVRLRLSERLRRDFDSVDLVQAVWASFFVHRDRLGGFNDPNGLCAYLARMAERKVLMAARHENRLKRGGERRRQLDSTIAESSKMAGREDRPSEIAIAAETWERLISKLSLRDQRILYLRNQGYTRVDIAKELSVAESTVRRVLDDLKKSLES
ncbi:MAG: sigma-70 family RNA polymerase sigma factor [Pirellulales bacterium]